MKPQTTYTRVFKGMIVLFVMFFLSASGFQDKMTSGWYRQYITNLNGSTIKDMTFLDSLTGFAVTTTNSSVQSYILKTTNGGDNWNIIYTYVPPSVNSGFTRVLFANNNTGYASTNYFDLLKTTNSGLNWTLLTTPWGGDDMAVINTDTILLVDYDPIMGGVYRSINGGINWSRIWTVGSNGNPKKIYMFDKNMGFSCDNSYTRFRKTSNGGFNWLNIADSNFFDIKFIDSLTGWKVNGSSVKKTTNGGINWFAQTTPSMFSFSGGSKLSVLNKDTVWYVGPTVMKNGFPYGVIIKTTNGGLNWGYQIPDTSIKISNLYYLIFTNRNNGWAFQDSNGVHTKIGGNDTTYYTEINNNTTTVPEDYVLYQNYPNPFNPTTNIKYKILKSSNIRIDVTDMLGRYIKTLINKKHSPGNYEVGFSGENISSGIYFYSLRVDDKIIQTRRMLLMK